MRQHGKINYPGLMLPFLVFWAYVYYIAYLWWWVH